MAAVHRIRDAMHLVSIVPGGVAPRAVETGKSKFWRLRFPLIFVTMRGGPEKLRAGEARSSGAVR